ncbi:hypothetical protein [Streptomyces sp. NPDC059909]|uniref:hypothetical protein n=1 Tax=Streptomyces sp. NPDC059909 TaxID=3346998 RepID=UPI003668314D
MVAWDGTCVEVADSPANVTHFGRHAKATSRPAGYPQVRLAAPGECGTKALIEDVSGPLLGKELPQARRLLPALGPGILLLTDRGYDGFEAIRDAAATGADLLWRAQSGRLLPVIQPLPDGSHLSQVLDRRSADRLAAWQRLRSTAHELGHCEDCDHDRWWHQVRHFDARDEAAERDRIRQAR